MKNSKEKRHFLRSVNFYKNSKKSFVNCGNVFIFVETKQKKAMSNIAKFIGEKNPMDRIINASSMLDVSRAFYDIWRKYNNLFTVEVRKRHKDETNAEWNAAIVEVYGDRMRADRREAFMAIPSRLTRCIMYRELAKDID